MLDFYGMEKVKKSINPLKKDERIAPPLNIHSNYYISFAGNEAYPCRLMKYFEEFGIIYVEVNLTNKKRSKEGFVTYSKRTVGATGIGLTPEHAVQNQL